MASVITTSHTAYLLGERGKALAGVSGSPMAHSRAYPPSLPLPRPPPPKKKNVTTCDKEEMRGL